MKGLYPEPPHLTVAVYPGVSEEHCFAALCTVTEEAGCGPQGLVEVAPWGRSFELRSDLAGVASKQQVDASRFREIVSGKDGTGRPVRAGYLHKKFGVIVVEYLGASEGDRHPIAVSLGAGPLGIPDELWGKADRSGADRLAEWTKNLLSEASSASRAWYGGIGIEYTLATPSALLGGDAYLPSEVFISRALLASSAGLEAALREDFGPEEAAWEHGSFLSAWAPYNGRKVTLPGIPARFRKSSQAVGRAVRSMNHGPAGGRT
jgi:hypothetical protein